MALINEKTPSKDVISLMNKLKQDFSIYVVSNNKKNRVELYTDNLGVRAYSFSMKPSIKALHDIAKTYKYKKSEMIIIGDQFVTDILAGKRFKIKTIFVDPLNNKDLKITGVNRVIEKIIINRLNKKKLFKRGNYYG